MYAPKRTNDSTRGFAATVLVMQTVEELLGVPLPVVEAWANTMSQLQRAVQHYEQVRGVDKTKEDILELMVVSLQGRLSGVGVTWLFMNNRRDESDDVLMAAHQRYLQIYDVNETFAPGPPDADSEIIRRL